MFWYNRKHPDVTYMDIRELEDTLCDGRKLEVKPDIIGDFTDIPFPDSNFDLIVFDPPHLIQGGESSWIVKKYGRLDKDTWRETLHKGMKECMRVLKDTGTVIFKWNETQVKAGEVIKALGYEPLFGNRTSKNTIWLVFKKEKKDEI